MLVHVEMKVKLPPDMDPDHAVILKVDEKTMSQKLRQEGVWRHLWRIAECYPNITYSI